ncbi:MAG: FG-GAP-like repeat-containing protein [Solirubrobacteraceae bacterium]
MIHAAWFAIAGAVALTVAQPATAAVDAFGSYGTSVPIDVPPFHDIAPSVRLVYDSSAGNGPVGMGWRLEAGSSITRTSAGRGAPHYDRSDRFWLDGQELIPCGPNVVSASCTGGGTHTTRVETYQRIEQQQPAAGTTSVEQRTAANRWVVWERDGTRLIYTPQRGDISDPQRTLRWALERVVDTHGNEVHYEYGCNTSGCELHTITYGEGTACVGRPRCQTLTVVPGVVIRLYWEGRPDPVSVAQGGFLDTIDRRVHAIEVRDAGALVRVYNLDYQPEPPAAAGYALDQSWLRSVRMFGTDAQVAPDGTVASGTALPAATYEAPAFAAPPPHAFLNSLAGNGELAGIEPPSPPPAVYPTVHLRALDASTLVIKAPFWPGSNASQTLTTTSEVAVDTGDFDGDGRLDAVQWQLTGSCTQHQLVTRATLAANPAGHVDNTQPWPSQRCSQLETERFPADLNGDGRTDIVYLQLSKVDPNNAQDTTYDGQLVAALSNGDGTFSLGTPTRLWVSDNQQDAFRARCGIGDVNGDHRSDFLCTTPQSGSGWLVNKALSDGAGGFHVVSESAPSYVSGKHQLVVADANGDGLDDVMLVDVRTVGGAELLDADVGVSLADGSRVWRRQSTSLPAPAPNEQVQLEAGDFNGDARADMLLVLARANGADGSFTTFTSQGGASTDYVVDRHGMTGEMPSVSIGDANGDGLDDVLFAVRTPDQAGCTRKALGYDHVALTESFSVAGRFTFPTEFTACYQQTTWPWSGTWQSLFNTRAADVNGDRLVDYFHYDEGLAYDPSTNSVVNTLWLRDLPSKAVTQDEFTRWQSADVNGDGRQDWIYWQTDYPALYLKVVLSNADGTRTVVRQDFSLPVDSTGLGAKDYFVADVGGGSPAGPDGLADLVIVDDAKQTILTMLGHGDGTFALPVVTSYSVPIHARLRGHVLDGRGDVRNWRPMDVNGDGLADLVHTAVEQPASGPGSLHVDTLLAVGDGRFGASGQWQQQTWMADAVGEDHFANAYGDADVRGFVPADVDGDGRMDLVKVQHNEGGSPNERTTIWTLMARGGGSWAERSWPLRDALPATGNWFPMEANGDGRTDLVLVRTSRNQPPEISTLLSLGNGTWEPRANTQVSVAPAGVDLEATRLLRVADLDGDGRQDMVATANVSTPGAADTTAVVVIANRFPSFVASTTKDLPSGSADLRAWRLTDTSGSAVPELTRLQRSPDLGLDVVDLGVPEIRMTHTANGVGASEDISYTTSAGSHARMPLGEVRRVVGTVGLSAGANAPYASYSRYVYRGATYSYSRRQFLGFEGIDTTTDAGLGRASYDLTDACGAREQRTENRSPQGELLTAVDRSFYSVGSGAVARCSLQTVRNEEWERTATPRISRTDFVYDDGGNITSLTQTGDPATRLDDRFVETAYHPNWDAFILDRPAAQKVFGYAAGFGGIFMRLPLMLDETRYEYDHSGDYQQPPGDQGDLTRISRWDDRTNTYPGSTLAYDTTGNLTKTTGPPIPSNVHGVEVTTHYDRTYARFPTLTCTGPLCSTSVWNKSAGVVVRQSDANGVPTVFSYDALGRLTKVTQADGSFERWMWPTDAQTGTSAQSIEHETSDGVPGAGVFTSQEFFDGLGRATRTVDEGGVVNEVLAYDGASDRVGTVAAPRFATQQPRLIHYSYDALGRLQHVEYPDHTSSSLTYAVGSVTTRDARGAKVEYSIDPYARVTAVQEDRRQCFLENCPVVETAVTRYRYDALDRLLSIVDAKGHETTVDWTSMGGPKRACDPDRGCTQLEWNADGSPSSSVDANGSRLTWVYDAYGRPIERDAYNRAGVRSHHVRWTWDRNRRTGKPSGASLARIVNIDETSRGTKQGSTYHYDELGRTDRSRDCIDVTCAAMGFAYDPADRIKTVTYPDARGRLSAGSEQVSYRYGADGQLASVKGYVDSIKHDPAGNITRLRLANGITESRTFDPVFGWPLAVRILPRGGGNPLFEQTLTRGATGIVDAQTVKTPQVTRTDTFTHDDLGRLVDVTSPDPSRNLHLTYDVAGNLRTRSGWGSVKYQDPRHEHAITATGSGARYKYDAVGQLRASNTLHISWNDEQRPVEITDNANGAVRKYVYDSTGRRVKYDDAGGQVLEPNDWVQVDRNGISKWIMVEGQPIARRTGNATAFLDADALGNGTLVTDPAGATIDRNDYTVWGERTQAPSGSGIPTGFSSGQHDPTGLVHLDSRYYDPALAHFISADTIVPDIYAPQSLNRYAYALNDPATLNDPTGHAAGANCRPYPNGELGIDCSDTSDSGSSEAAHPANNYADASPLVQASDRPQSQRTAAGSSGATGYTSYNPSYGGAAQPAPIGGQLGNSAPKSVAQTQPAVEAAGYNNFLGWQDWDLSGAANFAAGFGSALSFGLTDVINDLTGAGHFVDQTSGLYSAGQWSGIALSVAFGVAHLGRNALYQGSIRRLFSDPRTWGSVRRTWSTAAGGLKNVGQSLHHWLIPQRWFAVNAGFNYFPLSAGLNSWLGSTAARRFFGEGLLRGVVLGIYGAGPTTAAKRLMGNETP